MNKKYIIYAVFGFTALTFLTLAGCTPNPKSYIDNRVERAKLINELTKDKDAAKAVNDEITANVTGDIKDGVAAEMKNNKCTHEEIRKLTTNEECYVNKLKELKHKENKDKANIDAAKKECYRDFKASKNCVDAQMPLTSKLKD